MAGRAAYLKLVKGARDASGAEPSPETPTEIANAANAVTLGGYALGLWWIAGGPAWAAVASILMDEVDGIMARERGETTKFGADLDWTSDLILSALTLRKLKAPLWAIPTSTVAQVYLKGQGFRPPLGSFRAALMLYGVIQQGYRRREAKALGL